MTGYLWVVLLCCRSYCEASVQKHQKGISRTGENRQEWIFLDHAKTVELRSLPQVQGVFGLIKQLLL